MTREVEAELWSQDAPVRVRVGVHFGAVERSGGGFVGVVISRRPG